MKTRITEVRYDKKVNLGNYESLAIGVTVSVGENCNEAQALKMAEAYVEAGLKGEAPAEAPTTAEAPAPAEEKPKTPAARTKKPTTSAEKKEATKAKGKAKQEEEVTAEDVKETFEGKKEATVKYDRDIAEHKHTLSTILDAEYPNWKKDADLKTKAGKLSKEILPGTPFKNAKGAIVDAFKAKIAEVMGEGEDL